MTPNRKICPICGQPKLPRNKTCGKQSCRGEFAEKRTKKRPKRQIEAEPFIRKCMKKAQKDMPNKDVCVVCGEFLEASLTTHHFDKKNRPNDVARLCGSCHRVFDSSNAGLQELKQRRKRYYKHNLELLK